MTDFLTDQEGMGGKGREGITAHASSVGNCYAFWAWGSKAAAKPPSMKHERTTVNLHIAVVTGA